MSTIVPLMRYTLSFVLAEHLGCLGLSPHRKITPLRLRTNKRQVRRRRLSSIFEPGSSKLRQDDQVILDRASRAYNDGRPIVMIITGTADRTGSAVANLLISQRRASAVLHALLDPRDSS